jgi:hypothetical protein
MWLILISKHIAQESIEMKNRFLPLGHVTEPAPTDLSDSIDLRLLVTGRLTPTAIPIRRDRAALSAALNRARSHADARKDSRFERIS